MGPHHPPFGGAANQRRMPSVVPPQNTLNMSIGDVVKMALDLRRTGGGGTYVPLPLDKVASKQGLNGKEDRNKKSNLKRAMAEYFKDLALIDPSRKNVHKSSKRSKGNRSRRRKSVSRSYSRSRSRSRSRSSSISRSS